MDSQDKQTRLLLIRLALRKLRQERKISSRDFDRMIAVIEAEERSLLADSGRLDAPSQEAIKSVVAGLNELRDAYKISPELADRVIRSYTQSAMREMKSARAAPEREAVRDERPIEERAAPAEAPEVIPMVDEVLETPKAEATGEVEGAEETMALGATRGRETPSEPPLAAPDGEAAREEAERRGPVFTKEALVEFFLDEKTIKGMIVLGSLLALAGSFIFLRRQLLNRYVLFSLLFLSTIGSFVAGCLTVLKTKQKTTGRGLLLLGSVLVPMNFWYLVYSGILAPSGREYLVGIVCTVLYAATGFLLSELLFVYLGAATAIFTAFIALYRLAPTAFPNKYAMALTAFAIAYAALSHIFGMYERTRKRRFEAPFYVTSHAVILISLFFYTPLLTFLPPGFIRLLAEVDRVSISIGLAILISVAAEAIYLYSALYRRERVWGYFFAVAGLYSVWLVLDKMETSGWSKLLSFAVCGLVYTVAGPLLRVGSAESVSQSKPSLAQRFEILSSPFQHVGGVLTWVVLGTSAIGLSGELADADFDFAGAPWRAISTLAVIAVTFGANVAVFRRQRDVCFCVITLFVPLLATLDKVDLPLHTRMPILLLYFVVLRLTQVALQRRDKRWSFIGKPILATSLVGVLIHLTYAATFFEYFCVDRPYAGAALCMFYLAFMAISLYIDRQAIYSYASLAFLTSGYLLFLHAQGLRAERYPLALTIEGVVLVFPAFLFWIFKGRGNRDYQRLAASPVAWFTIVMALGSFAGWILFAPEDIAEIPIGLVVAAVAAALHFGMVTCVADRQMCAYVAVAFAAAAFNLAIWRNSDLMRDGAPLRWFHFPMFGVPFSYLMLALSVLGLRKAGREQAAESDTRLSPNQTRGGDGGTAAQEDDASTAISEGEPGHRLLPHSPARSLSLFVHPLSSVSQVMCMVYLGVCLTQLGFFLEQDNSFRGMTIALLFAAFYAMSTYHLREHLYSYLSTLAAIAAFLMMLLWLDIGPVWYPSAMIAWCIAGLLVGVKWRNESLIEAPMRCVPNFVSFIALISGSIIFRQFVAGDLEASRNEGYVAIVLASVLFSAYHFSRATLNLTLSNARDLSRDLLHRQTLHLVVSFGACYLSLFVIFHWGGMDYSYYLCGGMFLSLLGTFIFDCLRRNRPGTAVGVISRSSRIAHEGFSCIALIIYLVMGVLSLLPESRSAGDPILRAALFAFALGAAQSAYLAWSFVEAAYCYISMFCVAAALFFGLTTTGLEYYQYPCILALHPLLCVVVAGYMRWAGGEGGSERPGAVVESALPSPAQCIAAFVICFQLLSWRDTPHYHFYAMITALEMSLFYGTSSAVYRKPVFSYMSFTFLVAAFSCFLEFSHLTPRKYYGLAHSFCAAVLTIAAYILRGFEARSSRRRGESGRSSPAGAPLWDIYSRPLFNVCAVVLLVIAGGYAVFWRSYYPNNLDIVAYSFLISSAIFLSFALFDVRTSFLSGTATTYVGTIFTTFSYATLLRHWGVPNEWFGLWLAPIGAVYFFLGGYLTKRYSLSTGAILFRKGYAVTVVAAALSIHYPTEAAWVFSICAVLYGVNALFDAEHRRLENDISSHVSGCFLLGAYYFVGRAVDLASQWYGLWAVGFPTLTFAVSAAARQTRASVLAHSYLRLGRMTYAIAAAGNLWLALVKYPVEYSSDWIPMTAILAMMCLSLGVSRVFAVRSCFGMSIVFAITEHWLLGHYLGLTLKDNTEYYSVPAGIAFLVIGWLQMQGRASHVLARASGVGGRLSAKEGEATSIEAKESRGVELFDLIPYSIFFWLGSLLIVGPTFYHSIDPAIREELQPLYIVATFVVAVLLMGWGKFVQWKAPLYTGIAAFAGRLIVLIILHVEFGGGKLWIILGAIGVTLFVAGWLLSYRREKLLAWRERLRQKRDEMFEDLQKWK